MTAGWKLAARCTFYHLPKCRLVCRTHEQTPLALVNIDPECWLFTCMATWCRWAKEIISQVEQHKVSLCRPVVMNLSTFHRGFHVNPIARYAQRHNKSSRDHREVKHSVFMKSDMAIGPPFSKHAPLYRVPVWIVKHKDVGWDPCPAQLDHSAIGERTLGFWNVRGHAKFMFNHK